MIETFLSNGTLDTPAAFFASLLIGIAFGAALEQAGFGSSRRLAGIFYFRDMAVLKVMFTAVIVAMIGLSYAKAFGWAGAENIYFMETFYGAQIVGGLIFGAGFVISGWCPGTGAVGLASGKIDALVFLFGAVGGGMLYNELHPLLNPIFSGSSGVLFVYDSLGVSEAGFAFFLTLAALASFWGSEFFEKMRHGTGYQWGTTFMKVFSVTLVAGAFGLFAAVAGPHSLRAPGMPKGAQEAGIMAGIKAGADHMEPYELADRLASGDLSIVLADIRTPGEFARFHLRTAVNIGVDDLHVALAPHKNQGIIVLYSNGMTHPAQAWDSLARLGFENVYFLTDGLDGFLKACLMPVSLRDEPVSRAMGLRIQAWREFFLAPGFSSGAGFVG